MKSQPNRDIQDQALLSQLTERQLEVACLLAAGLVEREIAERLQVSEHTVHEHVRHIYERLDCHTRAELVRIVIRTGACDSSPK